MNRTDFIKKTISGKVLDLGCNQDKLHKIIANKNVFGLDVEVTYSDGRIIQCDAQEMAFKDNIFDTVVAGELIEHLPHPDKLLKECKRILKKDGILILTTNNEKSLVNRIFKSYHHAISHISLFDMPSLKKLISKYFVIERLFCLPYGSFSIFPLKNFYWLRNLIHYFLPQTLQENVVLVARIKN